MMTTNSLLIAIISATLGAFIGGLLRAVLDGFDRARNRQSILKAFAGEVGMLCWIIRHQYHPARWRSIAGRVEAGEAFRLALDLTQNYFLIFENLSLELGRLRRDEAATVTEFYTLCKIAIDTVGHRSPYADKPANMRFAADALEHALRLGTRIAGLPNGDPRTNSLGPPFDWQTALDGAVTSSQSAENRGRDCQPMR